MKAYELALVMKPTATEEEVQATLEKIKTLIAGRGGVVEKVNIWGKRRLASIIEKQTEGIFTFINFRTPPSDISEVTRVIQLTETVIRFIIVKEEGKAIRAVQESTSKTPPSSPEPEQEQPLDDPVEEAEPLEA